MNTILIFTSLGSLLYGAFVATENSAQYLIWIVSFVGIYVGWTLFISSTSIMSAVSFHFSDTSSSEMFVSIVLPWVSGIAAAIVLIALIFKYSDGNNHYGGDSNGWGGGSDGGCGGDGGD